MKKTPLLNAPISRVIAMMGHTDTLCISDAGLPIPVGAPSPERIDLALIPGIPSVQDLLATVMEEMSIQRAVLAGEIQDKNPEVLRSLRLLLGDIPVEFIPHGDFKALSGDSRAIVRTGECTPFSSIILYSGVIF